MSLGAGCWFLCWLFLFIVVGTCLPLIHVVVWQFTAISGLAWLIWRFWVLGGFVVVWVFTMDFRFGFSFWGGRGYGFAAGYSWVWV